MALTNYHAEQALTKRALSHHILLKLGFALSSGMTMNLGLFNLYMPPVLADSLSWVQIGGAGCISYWWRLQAVCLCNQSYHWRYLPL